MVEISVKKAQKYIFILNKELLDLFVQSSLQHSFTPVIDLNTFLYVQFLCATALVSLHLHMFEPLAFKGISAETCRISAADFPIT